MADQPDVIRTDQRNLERVVTYCPVPDDVVSNASYTLTLSSGNWPASGLSQIDKTYNGLTYRRTITGWGTATLTISTHVEQ